MSSFVIAAIYACYRKMRLNDHRWICKETGVDIANGASLFPLLILVTASFNNELIKGLLSNNKIIFSVAGVFALLSILDEGEKSAT